MLIFPSEDQESELLLEVSRSVAVHKPHDAAGQLGISRKQVTWRVQAATGSQPL